MHCKTMFLLTLLLGTTVAVVGFLAAAFTNLGIPFAPSLFVLGIILLFGSAVVYELFPH